MDRKNFIKTCGLGCLAALGPPMFSGCMGTKYLNAPVSGGVMSVPLGAFRYTKKGEVHLRPYVVAYNERLPYPVCVYRESEEEYRALSMRCTHQGAELNVIGDRLECPAHGSEFSNTGEALKGPAQEALRSFPVRVDGEVLIIEIKEQGGHS